MARVLLSYGGTNELMAHTMEQKKRYLRNQKLRAMQHKGGKCVQCGYSDLRYPGTFAFHHVVPEEKEHTVSQIFGHKWETVVKELDKCVMLCLNCHAKVHTEDEMKMKTEANGAFDKCADELIKSGIETILSEYLIRDGSEHNDGSVGSIRMSPQEFRDMLAFMGAPEEGAKGDVL